MKIHRMQKTKQRKDKNHPSVIRRYLQYLKARVGQVLPLFFLITLFLTGLLITSESFALQIKSAKDNVTIKARIASNSINRIFVQGDRISNVKGQAGAYRLNENARLGDIFIQPIGEYQAKPFTLFLTTEAEHRYTLLLIPVPQPSATIEIYPQTFVRKTAQRWERSAPYAATLSRLITAMYNTQPPKGYGIQPIENAKEEALSPGLTRQLVTIYHGAHYQGNIYRIMNKSKKPIRLRESRFKQAGVLAVTLDLDEHRLQPNEQTLLYEVTKNG